MLLKEKNSRLPEHWLGMIQVIGAAILWGTAATFAKHLFNNALSPFDMAQMRLTLSFVILFLVLAIRKPSLLRVRRSDLGYLALFGIVGIALLQFSYLLTLSFTNVATALFLQYTAPIFILLLGLALRTEALTILKFSALIAALYGGYMIVAGTSSGFGLNPLGVVSGIVSALAFSFYSMYGKRGLKNYNSWTLLTWGMGFGSLAWCLYQSPWTLALSYGGTAWLQFLYIAVIATILPFGLYCKGLQYLSAFRAGLIGTIEPVVGATTAFFFLGERLTFTQVLGSGLILLGVALIQLNALHQGREQVYIPRLDLSADEVGK